MSRTITQLVACLILFSCACRSPSPPARVDTPPARADVAAPAYNVGAGRAAALAAIDKARAAKLADVTRAVSLPSIERLVQDADAVHAHVTDPSRDLAFVQRTLEAAHGYADVLSGGEDPYWYARGPMVKAYRSEWDDTLQPYALYVPSDYDDKRTWPLVVALHGAGSNHRHMLRRVFGLDNRPGESDEEASRNDLPFPDVEAIVVAPYGRGEIMGYDGLGEEDVLRVIADVRRAYKIDPARISLTGLSMGGGGTWTIGLRHPELFSALAPVCGVTDVRKWIKPEEAGDYDLKALEALSPLAFAENAARLRVFIFHGDADPVVPVTDSRRMVERFKALGWLGKTVTYTEYPGVDHHAWVPAYKDAALLRTLAEIKRDPKAPSSAPKRFPADRAVPALFGKSAPRERPHIYVYGTHGAPDAVAAARTFAETMADWGPGVSARFAVKSDVEVSADDKAHRDLVLVGAAPFNALAPAARPVAGDAAFRLVTKSPFAKDHRMLVLGAATPAGFARLRRFAVHNTDHWAPESNRDDVAVP
ncbi:MAG TPA: prolyl oligopeptidase family serine peptidase [Polyangia bacterium]|jgi:poly(3-hydroxybutyrate) depolymerase|nr:prolyl oligopeptidase family serine peptidase [Polyangia bacterium]